MEKIRIAIDAGHGSNTAGKRTPLMPVDIDFEKDGTIDVKKGTSIREHIANVGVCIFLEQELTRCGFEILKSGYDDENAYDDADIRIEERQRKIREAKADYSVSVHFNAYGSGATFNSGNGISTYIHSVKERIRDSKRLADCVQRQLVQGSIQKNRGVQTGPFGMVNCIGLGTKASVLVELAFMTNEMEAINYMGDSDFWKESAVEICKGFCDYLSIAYVPEVKVKYMVQAGAFIYLQNARSMRQRVRKVGYKDAYIKKEKFGEKDIYRIQVGVYSIKENAIRTVEKLSNMRISAFYRKIE